MFLHYCCKDKREYRKEISLKRRVLTPYMWGRNFYALYQEGYISAYLFLYPPREWRLLSESYFTKGQVTPGVMFSSLLCSWAEWWIQVSSCHFLSFILFHFHHLCEFRGEGNWGRAHSLSPDDYFGPFFSMQHEDPCRFQLVESRVVWLLWGHIQRHWFFLMWVFLFTENTIKEGQNTGILLVPSNIMCNKCNKAIRLP